MSDTTLHNQPAKGDADGLRVAMATSSFNGDQVAGLLQGAVRALKDCTSQECTLVKCGARGVTYTSGATEMTGIWNQGADGDRQKILNAINNSKGNSARYMVHAVPGALELPLAAKWLTEQNEPPDAIVALGVVVRGQTPHFDYVSSSCMQGLLEVSLRSSVPVACGVLTVDTLQQAKERSADDEKNRGYSAMHAAISMASLRKRIHVGIR